MFEPQIHSASLQIASLRQLFRSRRQDGDTESGTVGEDAERPPRSARRRPLLLSIMSGIHGHWVDTQWSDTQWVDTRQDSQAQAD